MAIASFEEFCEEFCEIAGIEPPELAPDQWGTLAFSMQMRDIALTALQVPSRPDMAYVMAELGPMPQDRAQEGWRTLMDTNKVLLGQDAPVFSRNPETGEVVLQQSLPLARSTVAELFARIEGLTEMACQWQQGRLPSQAPASDDAPRASMLVSPTTLA
jgi:hypothetical protein